jgi:hypothetical protein
MTSNVSNAAFDNETFSETDLPEWRTTVALWVYASPVLIVLGTVTNALSILVLVRKAMRASPTMFYLCVLAVADILVLYTGLLRQWVLYTFEVDFRDQSEFTCKFGLFIVYFTVDFSVWTLVAVTIDRCISVCLPLKSKKFHGLRNARISMCVYGSLLFALNCHFFWTAELITGDDGSPPSCIASPHNLEFNIAIWPWIDLCFFCAVPFTVMIVCNILIIRHIVVSRRHMQAHTESNRNRHFKSETGGKSGNANNNGKVRSPKFRNTHNNGKVQSAKSRNTNNSGKVQSVTVMLLTVNILFLVLTAPIVIQLTGMKYWYSTEDPRDNVWLMLMYPIANLMMYTNSVINFFLYCMTGPRFRRELCAMFKCWRSCHSHSKTDSVLCSMSRGTTVSSSVSMCKQI